MNKYIALLLAGSVLGGCSLAPNFELPDFVMPKAFKEQLPATKAAEVPKGQWQPAVPLEKEQRGEWWRMFADPKLDALERQAVSANQSLRAAAARVAEARAIVEANASTLLPQITADTNVVRAKSSNSSTAGFSATNRNLSPYTLYSVGAQASYEMDLFARVRDNERAFNFEADAQDAMYNSMLLALQADVAQHYFTLRAMDAQRVLLRQTVEMRTEAERIMQKRFDVGTVGEVELSRARGDLAAAKADLLALDRARGVKENALAVLLGQNPSEYHFEEAPLAEVVPPVIPAGLPSSLLLRRPDITAAQASMAAANRRIGVARTAFFPRLILTATGGFQSTDLSDVLKWSSRSWSLGQIAGDAISMTLFDSGRNIARVDVANAVYDEAVANWRQRGLVAFGEVENALSDQRLLAEQATQQDIAASAASRTLTLSQKRYTQGEVNYFEVVSAQRDALNAGRAAIETRGQRMLAAVSLIRALGGGWDDIPVDKVEAPAPTEKNAPVPTEPPPPAAPPAPSEPQPVVLQPAAPEIVPVKEEIIDNSTRL